MQENMDNRMTVQEIADFVGVTEPAVRYWAKAGKFITFHKSSNGRLYALKDEVRKFAEGYVGRRRPHKSAAS